VWLSKKEGGPSSSLHPARESTTLSSEGGIMHMLVDEFDVFGVHIQYWMLLAVAMVAVAIGISLRRLQR
jgi:hypothetical protein